MYRADPTPVLSPADIPDWDYLPEIDLADYLDAHPHQHVFRIFAGTVTLSRSISRRTSITDHALDLRIDCNELHIGIDPARPNGIVLFDVSGMDSDSTPGSVVGWKTWAPETESAEDGEAGFDGGSIEINALSVFTAQSAVSLDLDILQLGGKGGNGQQGYWGADGVAGISGRDGADTNIQPNPDYDVLPGDGANSNSYVRAIVNRSATASGVDPKSIPNPSGWNPGVDQANHVQFSSPPPPPPPPCIRPPEQGGCSPR
ncbi:hypothetical protein [Caulobacter sp. Root655]|uniref:hypothetical protein n=1 Tax=Caulobacter sp. Root655 TaxID=1736578 RepID=UPI000AD4DEF9|nr:hypothetical protein [Caulobacter sp. Root655]